MQQRLDRSSLHIPSPFPTPFVKQTHQHARLDRLASSLLSITRFQASYVLRPLTHRLPTERSPLAHTVKGSTLRSVSRPLTRAHTSPTRRGQVYISCTSTSRSACPGRKVVKLEKMAAQPHTVEAEARLPPMRYLSASPPHYRPQPHHIHTNSGGHSRNDSAGGGGRGDDEQSVSLSDEDMLLCDDDDDDDDAKRSASGRSRRLLSLEQSKMLYKILEKVQFLPLRWRWRHVGSLAATYALKVGALYRFITPLEREKVCLL